MTKKIDLVNNECEHIWTVQQVQIKREPNMTPILSVEGSVQMGGYLIGKIGSATQEILMVLFINEQNEVIGQQEVFKGLVNHTYVSPYQIFQTALLMNSSRLILAHNHPSGKIKPSLYDIKFAKKIQEAGKLLDIELVDSLVVTDNNYYSMNERQNL